MPEFIFECELTTRHINGEVSHTRRTSLRDFGAAIACAVRDHSGEEMVTTAYILKELLNWTDDLEKKQYGNVLLEIEQLLDKALEKP